MLNNSVYRVSVPYKNEPTQAQKPFGKAAKGTIKAQKDETKAQKDETKAQKDETKAQKDETKAQKDETKTPKRLHACAKEPTWVQKGFGGIAKPLAALLEALVPLHGCFCVWRKGLCVFGKSLGITYSPKTSLYLLAQHQQ